MSHALGSRDCPIELGIYDFAWSGGTFRVELRQGGVFWCRKFANTATWTWDFTSGTLSIDWGKYGKYTLAMKDGTLEGSVVGQPDDWRKATFVRARTAAESLIDASGWMLSYEGGAPFRVEFHSDGHFHAPDYPGHFVWMLDGTNLTVNWGKFGTYDMKVDIEARTIAGSMRGNESSWRKLEYVEPLPATQSAHSHSH